MQDKALKTIYKCPVCQSGLTRQERQYACDKGHNFDISEKGYVNLLLASQKKTKDPGDSKEMMESRKSFLDKGYYTRLSEGLNRAAAFHINEKSEYILDAGCGEGYFISKLKNKLSGEENKRDINYYGIDISKSAIRYALKRDNSIYFAVGSNFSLPIIEGSCDCIIKIFAPGDDEEIYHVLKNNGKFIIVTPGIEHLFELKEKLYERARKHEAKDSVPHGFRCIDHQEIQYSISLQDHEDIENLISMTPYYWSITRDMRNKISYITFLTTALHFNIDVYSKI